MKRTIRRGSKKTRNKKTRNKKTRSKNNRKLKSKAIKRYSKKMRGGEDEKIIELEQPIIIELGNFSKRLFKKVRVRENNYRIVEAQPYSPNFTLKITKIYIKKFGDNRYIELNFTLHWKGTDILGNERENNIHDVNFDYYVSNSNIDDIYLLNSNGYLRSIDSQPVESHHFTLENKHFLLYSIITRKNGISSDILKKIYTEIDKTIRTNEKLKEIIRGQIPSPKEEKEEEEP